MKLIVDGKAINAEKGQTVIQAMEAANLNLPHFCWHPALSVSGNCRMCLVEIGHEREDADGNKEVSYIPKLQIGCATPVTEGMHVRATSEKVLKARKGVMEFILISHPLDCPICDEAGECKLQEYTLKHSVGTSRYTEEKTHKPKRTKWSDKVIYDAERCIMCSRCIRFAKEVAKQDVLTFKNRGDHVYIEVEEGKTFDNEYSMNVIDICPVGALTSADFRFQSRVWDMSFADTISPLDSTGSKITLGIKQNKILRSTPAKKCGENGYWITDETRLGVLKFNDNRVEHSIIKTDGISKKSTAVEAVKEAVNRLKKYKPNEVLFIASPHASNESNKEFIEFAKNIFKTANIAYVESIDNSVTEDDKLIVKDKSPNLTGLKNIMPKIEPISKIDNSIKAVYILEENFEYNTHFFDELKKAEFIISHSLFKNKVYDMADIVLATSSIFESTGSITNRNGVTQTFKPIIKTAEGLTTEIKEGRLDKFGADNDKWNQYEIRKTLQSTTLLKMMKTYWK